MLISEKEGVELHVLKEGAWQLLYSPNASVARPDGAHRALRVIWGDILGATGEPTPFGVVEALRERLPDVQE